SLFFGLRSVFELFWPVLLVDVTEVLCESPDPNRYTALLKVDFFLTGTFLDLLSDIILITFLLLPLFFDFLEGFSPFLPLFFGFLEDFSLFLALTTTAVGRRFALKLKNELT